MLQAIQRQLEEVEERQRASESKGVRLEKALRGEAGKPPGRSNAGDSGLYLWSENSAGWANHQGKTERSSFLLFP